MRCSLKGRGGTQQLHSTSEILKAAVEATIIKIGSNRLLKLNLNIFKNIKFFRGCGCTIQYNLMKVNM